MAYIGKSIESGTFSVLDTSGNTYNGSNTAFNLGTQVGSVAQLLVSHDGVIQKPGTDYTLSSGGTAITFSTAPASGASIFIVEISGAVGGPLDSDLNGTELILDADGDTSITADTDDQIDVKIAGADDFKFSANAMNVLSGSTLTIDSGATITNSGTANGFGTDPDGAQVFNESSADVDFRVESNGNTHMFFIDGGNNRVGMVTTPDLGTGLHIRTADSGGAVEANADELVVEGSGNTGISILSGTSSVGAVHFNDSGGNERGAFKYNHAADDLQIKTGGSEKMRIESTGSVEIKIDGSGFKNFVKFENLAGDTTYGVVGAEGANNAIIGSGDTALKVDSANDIVRPYTISGTGGRDDAIDLGSSSHRFNNVFAGNGTIQTSDKNQKNTITATDLGLAFVDKLTPVSYKLNNGQSGRTHYGLIAQDVETILGDISKSTTDFAGFIKTDISADNKDDLDKVTKLINDNVDPLTGEAYIPKKLKTLQDRKTEIENKNDTVYGLRYQEFISPIVKAIQELSARVTTLEG